MNGMGESREGDFENDPQMSALCRGWRVAPLTETRSAGEDSGWKGEDTRSGLRRHPAKESFRNLNAAT